MKVLFAILTISLLLTGCGVKNELVKPNGQSNRDEKDPSKPPYPLGR